MTPRSQALLTLRSFSFRHPQQLGRALRLARLARLLRVVNGILGTEPQWVDHSADTWERGVCRGDLQQIVVGSKASSPSSSSSSSSTGGGGGGGGGSSRPRSFSRERLHGRSFAGGKGGGGGRGNGSRVTAHAEARLVFETQRAVNEKQGVKKILCAQ